MATASVQTLEKMRANVLVERWFFTGLAMAMLATSAAGFLPSLVHTAGRRAPLSPLTAAHGVVFFTWLGIFFVQSRLIATGARRASPAPRSRRRLRPGTDDPIGINGLGECRSFGERIRFSNQFLMRRCLDVRGGDGISAAASRILLGRGDLRIAALANHAGLSMRQFERRFMQQVGIRPKLYARIARFEAALDSKARSSTKSWTDVAHECGYYDQMHMVHDFEDFTGETPSNLLGRTEMVFREQIEAMRSGPRSVKAGRNSRLIL